jgi:hypothetical protein
VTTDPRSRAMAKHKKDGKKDGKKGKKGKGKKKG